MKLGLCVIDGETLPPSVIVVILAMGRLRGFQKSAMRAKTQVSWHVCALVALEPPQPRLSVLPYSLCHVW